MKRDVLISCDITECKLVKSGFWNEQYPEKYFGASFLTRKLYLSPRSKADFGTVEIAKKQLHGGFGASELTQTRWGITDSEPFLPILDIELSSTVSI
ncbi:hypothetical protein TNCV_1862611 [Trichonephila clavipes]|nr:hypothetical protein TNCV_1862611 [Trichonephila clavipes]